MYLGGAQLPVILSWDWRDGTGRVLPVYMYYHCQGHVCYVDSTLLGKQVYCWSTGTTCAGDLAAVRPVHCRVGGGGFPVGIGTEDLFSSVSDTTRASGFWFPTHPPSG